MPREIGTNKGFRKRHGVEMKCRETGALSNSAKREIPLAENVMRQLTQSVAVNGNDGCVMKRRARSNSVKRDGAEKSWSKTADTEQ